MKEYSQVVYPGREGVTALGNGVGVGWFELCPPAHLARAEIGERGGQG